MGEIDDKGQNTPPRMKDPRAGDLLKLAGPRDASSTRITCPNKITVVIDPGHGDNYYDDHKAKKEKGVVDPGAVYSEKGTAIALEKDIALAIAKAIKTSLSSPNVQAVVLTREGDVTTPVPRFQWRTDVAVSQAAKIFVSLHTNSAGEKATGHVVYYYSPNPTAAMETESKELAEALSNAFTTIAAFSGGGTRGQVSKMGLVKFGGASTVQAAVLVETGFITNTADRASLTTKAEALGAELAAGLLAYIDANIDTLCAAAATP